MLCYCAYELGGRMSSTAACTVPTRKAIMSDIRFITQVDWFFFAFLQAVIMLRPPPLPWPKLWLRLAGMIRQEEGIPGSALLVGSGREILFVHDPEKCRDLYTRSSEAGLAASAGWNMNFRGFNDASSGRVATTGAWWEFGQFKSKCFISWICCLYLVSDL